MPETKPVRVRMAPSPTGFFHVGSARTALFNFLLARHTGGTFVLRVEDTDQTRGTAEYEEVIYNALDWLGLFPDEGPKQGGNFGPYRQSERFATYAAMAQQLLESGKAYYAFETSEELAQMRADQAANKQPPRYNGAHRNLTAEQIEAFRAEGRKPVLRLLVPEGETHFDDLVYGSITWKNKEIDDFVIAKSDGGPTYNFACAVDDHLMEISHVIRGEDGLSNTPRQLLIYKAFGWEEPTFAHLPFLLGLDRKKLSKRSGSVNLLDFGTRGVLPDAMFNFLALLGWNPGKGETQEIFTREELIERFTLEAVNKAGAIFDEERLAWMNAQYLKAIPIEEFLNLVRPSLEQYDLSDEEYAQKAVEMTRERLHGLPDIAKGDDKAKYYGVANFDNGANYFFSDEYPMDATGATKHLTPENLALLEKLTEKLEALENFDAASIEGAIREQSTESGVKVAALVHPTRLLVSGKTVGPSLWELLAVLGRERVIRRLKTGNIQ
ncbi:glutamate--tRNA ligase [bacterium]|nr:MAG: glutamate--tRNA ligase [bacterium]